MDQYDDPFLWPEFSGFVDWESLFERHREEELLDILETLVRRGFDIDKPSVQMKTAMHKAAHYGYVELKRFLIEQGASIRRKAYRSSPKALARREKASLNYTPLHYAARNGGSEMVRLLLDYEAGLDCWGRRTPFNVDYAAKRDDTLWILIEYRITERREALEELPTINADSLLD